MVMDYAFRAGNGEAGRDGFLSAPSFAEFLGNRKLKNGFVMTILAFETMNEPMREMKRLSRALMDEIDTEMKRYAPLVRACAARMTNRLPAFTTGSRNTRIGYGVLAPAPGGLPPSR